jgi:hypothetical protein
VACAFNPALPASGETWAKNPYGGGEPCLLSRTRRKSEGDHKAYRGQMAAHGIAVEKAAAPLPYPEEGSKLPDCQ